MIVVSQCSPRQPTEKTCPWRARIYKFQQGVLLGITVWTLLTGLKTAQADRPTLINHSQQQRTIVDATGDMNSTHQKSINVSPTGALSRRFDMEPKTTGQRTKKASTTLPLVTVGSSLAIVLGLFGGLIWLVRRSSGKPQTQLPESAFTVLGRFGVGPRQNILLVRCAHRVLVLADSAGSIATLSEITDPAEVADLVVQCGSDSSKSLFNETLRELGTNLPAAAGFVEPSPPHSSHKLFTNV